MSKYTHLFAVAVYNHADRVLAQEKDATPWLMAFFLRKTVCARQILRDCPDILRKWTSSAKLKQSSGLAIVINNKENTTRLL